MQIFQYWNYNICRRCKCHCLGSKWFHNYSFIWPRCQNVWCATTSWNGAIAISGGEDGSVIMGSKKVQFAAPIGHTLSNKNESDAIIK